MDMMDDDELMRELILLYFHNKQKLFIHYLMCDVKQQQEEKVCLSQIESTTQRASLGCLREPLQKTLFTCIK